MDSMAVKLQTWPLSLASERTCLSRRKCATTKDVKHALMDIYTLALLRCITSLPSLPSKTEVVSLLQIK